MDFLLPFYRTSETFVIRKEVPLPWMLFLNTVFISTWICQTKFVDDRSLQSDSNEMMSLVLTAEYAMYGFLPSNITQEKLKEYLITDMGFSMKKILLVFTVQKN